MLQENLVTEELVQFIKAIGLDTETFLEKVEEIEEIDTESYSDFFKAVKERMSYEELFVMLTVTVMGERNIDLLEQVMENEEEYEPYVHDGNRRVIGGLDMKELEQKTFRVTDEAYDRDNTVLTSISKIAETYENGLTKRELAITLGLAIYHKMVERLSGRK